MPDELTNLSAGAATDHRGQTIIDDAAIVFARLTYLDDFAKIAVINEIKKALNSICAPEDLPRPEPRCECKPGLSTPPKHITFL